MGNELGAGNAEAAKLSVYTCVVMVALVQSVLAVACKLTDRQVVGLLSNNKEVEELTISTMPILLPTFVCEYHPALCAAIWHLGWCREGEGG